MPEIKKMLEEKYLKDGARPPKSGLSNPKKEPEMAGEVPPAPIKIKSPRTIGNVYVALEAQRVYDPSIPNVPAPAPANTFQKGVTPAMDTSGAWAGPAPRGER